MEHKINRQTTTLRGKNTTQKNTHALLLLAFLLELEYARPSLASAWREAAVSAASNDDEDDGDASRSRAGG